jgi:hypothetical protein
MLSDLLMEREQISEAIVLLARPSWTEKTTRRPPKWMTKVKRRGRPKGSTSKPKGD